MNKPYSPDRLSDFHPSARRVHDSIYEEIPAGADKFGLNVDWSSLIKEWRTNPVEAALITVVGIAVIAISYPEFKYRQRIQKQLPQAT